MLVRHFYINASYEVTMPIDYGEYCKVTHLVEIMFKHRRKGHLNYTICCEITCAIVKGFYKSFACLCMSMHSLWSINLQISDYISGMQSTSLSV